MCHHLLPVQQGLCGSPSITGSKSCALVVVDPLGLANSLLAMACRLPLVGRRRWPLWTHSEGSKFTNRSCDNSPNLHNFIQPSLSSYAWLYTASIQSTALERSSCASARLAIDGINPSTQKSSGRSGGELHRNRDSPAIFGQLVTCAHLSSIHRLFFSTRNDSIQGDINLRFSPSSISSSSSLSLTST